MDLQTLIVIISLGVALIAIASLVMLVTVYLKREARERDRFAQMQADISDMTVLFRTMRDVIAQQKSLAREFNEELEKKTSLVKQVLARGMEKNERLYERQQELESRIREAAAQLETLQRQLGYLQDYAEQYDVALEKSVPPPPHGFSPDERIDAAPAPPPKAAPAPPKPRPTPPRQEKIENPGRTGQPLAASPPSLAEDWAGLRLTPETQEIPAPLAVGTTEEHSAARDAFRALLDLEPDTAPEQAPLRNTDNGRGASTPVQRRVLEYTEAGMSIGDIARELGIGKGEVRLLLSLAKQSGS